MTASLMPLGKQQYFDSNGVPLVGGKVYTYSAGTTTPLATYTDTGGLTPNANPVVLDSRGEASIFFDTANYKIVLKDSADATIWTQDNLPGNAAGSVLTSLLTSLAASSGSSLVGYTPAGTGAVSTTVQAELRKTVFSSDYATLDQAFTVADTVIIPAGVTITLSSNFSVPRAGLTLIGQGFTSIISYTGNDRRISCNQNNFTVANLMIDGNKPSVGWETTNNYDFGVRVGEASGVRISGFRALGVKFKDIGLDGIYADNAEHIYIDDACVFDNCRRWGVAIVPGTLGVDDVYIGGRYDCSNGSGPVGKEYPFGAVDVEPDNPVDGGVSNVRYGEIYSNMGRVEMTTSGNPITKSTIRSTTVADAVLSAANITALIENSYITGTNGYLVLDSAADGTPTLASKLDVTFDTGRTPVTLADGRENLLPIDHGDDSAYNVASSISGTGTSTGYVTRSLDGTTVALRSISIGAAAGDYGFRHDLQATISIGDQVFMYFEIERTDSNSATGNFFLVTLGGGGIFSHLVLIQPGINKYVIAFKATSGAVNPRLFFGLSGTPGVAVTCLIRKSFVLVNPSRINLESLRVQQIYLSSSYTGTATGLTTSPTGSVKYVRNGNSVTVSIASGLFTGTSNSATFTVTGAPTMIRPTTAKSALVRAVDNGAGLTAPSQVQIETNGTLTFFKDCAGGTWTAAGAKAVSNSCFTYLID